MTHQTLLVYSEAYQIIKKILSKQFYRIKSEIYLSKLDLALTVYKLLFDSTEAYQLGLERLSTSELQDAKYQALTQVLSDRNQTVWAMNLVDYCSSGPYEKLQLSLNRVSPTTNIAYIFSPSLCHKNLVVLSTSIIQAIFNYRFASEIQINFFGVCDIPSVENNSSLLYVNAITKFFRAAYGTLFLVRSEREQGVPMIVSYAIRTLFKDNKKLYESFCSKFSKESDVFTSFYVSLFEFILNFENYEAYKKAHASLLKLLSDRTAVFPKTVYISIFGRLPSNDEQSRIFHNELLRLRAYCTGDQDISSLRKEISQLLTLRSHANHIDVHELRICLQMGFDAEQNSVLLSQKVVSNISDWLLRKELSLTSLVLMDFAQIYNTIDHQNVALFDFCLTLLTKNIESNLQLNQQLLRHINSFQWSIVRKQDEVRIKLAEKLKRIYELVLEKNILSDLETHSVIILVILMIESNAVSFKEMRVFFDPLKEKKLGRWLGTSLSNSGKLRVKEMIACTDPAISCLGTLIFSLNLTSTYLFHPKTGLLIDDVLTSKMWENAKAVCDDMKEVILNGMCYCSIPWKRYYKEMTSEIKKAEKLGLIRSWSKLIQKSPVPGIHDKDMFACALCKIIMDNNNFTEQIRIEATRRLSLIVSSIEPLAFNHQQLQLNLPLPK